MKRYRGSLGLLLLGSLLLASGLYADEDVELIVARIWTRDLALVAALQQTDDVWVYDPRLGAVTLAVTPERYAALAAAGLLIELDDERTASLRQRPEASEEEAIPGFPCFRTVEETYTSLETLAAANPDLTSWVDIGDSWIKADGAGTGYDIRALVITDETVPGPKFPFVLMAAMHARELATAELVTRFAETLVNGYGTDPDVTWILKYGAVHVIPHLNPDGRKRAEAGALWRKNTDNDFCANTNSRGIDLNRNSSFFWGGPSASASACSETFRGPGAASEPETQAIEGYFAQVFADQRGPALTDAAPSTATGLFISVHSFGEFVLYPWEGSTSASPNDAGLTTLARKFGFLNGYLACQSGLPPASGTTVDVAYGVYGVAGYTFEIGQDFFEPCSTFENTILPDNQPALMLAAKAARRPYLEPQGPEVQNVTLGPPSGSTVALTAMADDGRFASNGCGTEPVQTVASAGYSINTPPWQATLLPLAAADGAFDEAAEALSGSIDTSGLASGRHLVYVVATDSQGRQGLPSAIFLDVAAGSPIFADGFESGSTAAWTITVP